MRWRSTGDVDALGHAALASSVYGNVYGHMQGMAHADIPSVRNGSSAWDIVMVYTVMACVVMACIGMACIGTACIGMAYIVMACIIMACVVMAYVVMADPPVPV